MKEKKYSLFDILCQIAQNQGFWAMPITDLFFRFHPNKKSLNHFKQLLFHNIPPPMKLIYLVFSADILLPLKANPPAQNSIYQKMIKVKVASNTIPQPNLVQQLLLCIN